MMIVLDFEDALKAEGFTEIIHFSDVERAEAWLGTRRPHVAIVDLRLRDGSAAHLATLLRSEGVPVVICTAQDSSAFPPDLLDCPAFSKPCNPEAVARAAISLAAPAPVG